jgi:hypothetical protein
MRKPKQTSPAKGQSLVSGQDTLIMPAAGDMQSSDGSLRIIVDKTTSTMHPSDDPVIAEIRSWHRQRCFAMEHRKRADLALLAFLRSQLGWSLALPEAERKAIAAQAMKLLALGEKVFKGKATGIDNPAFGQWAGVILAAISARKVWDDIEAAAVKEMARLATSLPVWSSFGEAVRGFGPVSLAVIVGEAGDLAGYANPGKLWKRMGLAVFDGIRQGGLAKGASADAWIAHGYNRQRRSRMFVIGDCLVKVNRGEYRAIYDARKEYEKARDPEIKPIKAHRRAQRYMEKRLLKNLWQAWRLATDVVPPDGLLPAANNSHPAELRASTDYTLPGAKKRANRKMSTGKFLPASPQSENSMQPMPVETEATNSESRKRKRAITSDT